MRLAFYKGKSWVSKLIRWQTFGDYSHVGMVLDDNSIIEAWHIGGVLHNPSISAAHTPGTEVDVFRVRGISSEQAKLAQEFMRSLIGKKYDFRGVFRFLTRWNVQNDPNSENWFCSESVCEALKHAQYPLLRMDIPSFKISPFSLSFSPLIEFEEKIITTK